MLGHSLRARLREASRLFLLFSLAAAVLLSANANLPAQQGPATVVVAPIVDRPIVASRVFIGTAEPTRTSIVGSAVDGRVAEVLVEEGDEVEENQLLVSLQTGTIDIQLRAAQAEFTLRQQELLEMENGSRPEEIAQAEAEYATSEALWDYAKSALERTQELYERGNTISRDEYEERLSIANAARQRLLAAQAQLDLVRAGPRDEDIAQARARVEMAQAEVDRIEDLKSKYTIEAPFNGYVVAKHTEVGQWMQSGQPVIEMVRLDEVDIEVEVPEAYISNVELNSSASVYFESLGGDPMQGQISRIVPRANRQSRTFPVIVRLANPDGRVKAGMLADVTLAVDRRESALQVPKDALVLGGPTPVLYVIVPGQGENPPTVRPVPVETGLESGGMIQVMGEIQVGQQVVVEGNERVFGGNPVNITEVIEDPQ